MTKNEAILLLEAHVQNQNLRRHCLAVGATMRALAEKLGGDPDEWEILGIIHDSDWEETKDDISKHTHLTLDRLKAQNYDGPIIHALQTHNNRHTGLGELETTMEWALECCDELTGFIVACTLVLPSKHISDLSVESVIKKLSMKSFAAAVDRSQIGLCEEKLGIPLPEFVNITLVAMQSISSELGL